MAVALAIGLRRGEALGLRWINADPVNGWLLRRFRAWERTQVARANKLSLVFTTRNGTPLEPRNVNRALEALCRRANVRSIRLLSRSGARCRCCHGHVSPDRSPH